jgi:hypothetical protein
MTARVHLHKKKSPAVILEGLVIETNGLAVTVSRKELLLLRSETIQQQ